MKRLESIRRFRSVRGVAGQVRNAAEAVMLLSHVARERHGLEQERRSLGKRLTRIDARLTEMAGTEMRLLPAIPARRSRPAQSAHPAGARPDTRAMPHGPAESEPPAVPVPAPVRVRAGLPAGVTQVTLQY